MFQLLLLLWKNVYVFWRSVKLASVPLIPHSTQISLLEVAFSSLVAKITPNLENILYVVAVRSLIWHKRLKRCKPVCCHWISIFLFFCQIWLNSVLWPLCSFIASKRISSSHIVIANFLVKNVMRNFTRMQALWNKPFFYNLALWVHRFSIQWPFEIFRKNFVLLNLSTAPYSGQVYLILPLRKSWNRNLFQSKSLYGNLFNLTIYLNKILLLFKAALRSPNKLLRSDHYSIGITANQTDRSK